VGSGPIPPDLLLKSRLDNFGGAINILGRLLGAGEIRRMTYCANIQTWYSDQAEAMKNNVTQWTMDNPMQSETLEEARLLAKAEGYKVD
jgi:hypothetical protein